MIKKQILVAERVRRVPRQFSWVDTRLLSEQYFPRCSSTAWALYLFLIVAGDANGLSYYSDRAITEQLGVSESVLTAARAALMSAGLVAYRAPLYQVLSLATQLPAASSLPRGGAAQTPAQILHAILQRGGQNA